MKLKSKVFGFFFFFLVLPGYATSWSPPSCETVFNGFDASLDATKVDSSSYRISETELVSHVSEKVGKVFEFQFIRKLGRQMGVRVWLFGGTAASFLHYAKWDLARSKNLVDLQMTLKLPVIFKRSLLTDFLIFWENDPLAGKFGHCDIESAHQES